ncbi:BgtE-10112 [Blumeria graminis f. sp. tritici]|uniref:BgtE-10112 n=3 Tax=Blumeria graminis f. sp. tritici TaxID=62690 RepID=A0A9X9MHH7_BLUGR|nr:putative secreted effector protein [Blumeria graminis f. sp. tritici 96224]VDB88089.1 BgtE-10112 [Blumeria graminis f. sp. tritici]
MVCLLAILLYTGQRLAEKDRLLITTLEYNKPNYHIYKANLEQPFPVPGRGSGIYRTLVNVDEPGTYVTVYCSIKAPIDDLRRFVSKGLKSLPSRVDRRFDNDEKSENECFNHVNNLHLKSNGKAAKDGARVIQVQDPNPLPVSHLIKSHQCTKRLLISLAYQRRVLCAHGHGFLTTYSDENLPTIKFDEPVEIADAIFDGQFVIQLSKDGIQDVLAWSQGQLQSFKRYDSSSDWKLLTFTGNEPYSGWRITESIKSNNAQVIKFMNEFAKLENTKSVGLDCLMILFEASVIPKLCRDYKLEHLQVSVNRLDPIPAEGNIDRIIIRKPIEEDERRFIGQIS